MTIQEITERNFNATIRRGQIINKTQPYQFCNKIREELAELEMSLNQSIVNPFDIKELADIALVCFSMAKHSGYDLIKEMEKKMLYNETRQD